jgi:putative aldouronate transport system permease protein
MHESKSDLALPPLKTAKPSSSLWLKLKRFFNTNGTLLLMALPGMLILFTFSYLPMPGIVLAFKDFKAAQGIWGSEWVGLSNFEYLFSTGTAFRIIRNTVFINALFIAVTLVVSLAIAVLLHEIYDHFASRIYQSVLFFPYFVSFVIVGYFTFIFLSSDGGVVNGVLRSLGMQPVAWFNEPQHWPAILTLVNLWHSLGYFTIIYLAGIIAINPEYYEAARIDGANKWQEIWFIMLPLIRPLIIINVLLAVGRIFFANFDLFINVTRGQGALLPTTDVIDTYVFRSLTVLGNFNMAAAAGFFQAVVGLLLVLLANWIVRRVDNDQALF